MPILQPKGLRGLQGIAYLSDEEYNSFVDANRDIIAKYNYDPKFISNLYDNKLYIDKYGEEDFDAHPDINYRRNRYRNDVILETAQKTFGQDYNMLASRLDSQALYDLMTNEDYMGSDARKKQFDKDTMAAKEVEKSFDAAINNPHVDALGAGFMQIGKTKASITPMENYKKSEEKDEEIIKKLESETAERREEAAKPEQLEYYNLMKQDAVKYNQEFEALMNQTTTDSSGKEIKLFGHYDAFKNSKWLDDYTADEKLKDFAMYIAIRDKYGEDTAAQYLNRSQQNRIAEKQDGTWTGNTLKGIATTIWSDLGSDVALMSHLGESTERMAIWNQGLNPDKPIYNEKGQITGYQENENIVNNPAYWNDVYMYNSFKPATIKAIKERGGISEDVNVKEYGATPEFLSWETLQEGVKQSGHAIAEVIKTGALGGAGRAIGGGLGWGLKTLGTSAKTMSKLSKTGAYINDAAIALSTGTTGAQMESMGTFNEMLEDARQKIHQTIDREVSDYYNTLKKDKDIQATVEAKYQELKKADQQRLRSTREGVTQFPISDETLRSMAEQEVMRPLLEQKGKELEQFHKQDEQAAALAATHAYMSNWAMDYLKEVLMDNTIQKFKIAKGAKRGAWDNTITDALVGDAETGGVKIGKKYASGKNVAKELAKQFGGGFADEYMDGLNASFSSGIGSNEFDSYMAKKYNPEVYNAATESLLGNFLSGITSGVEGITDYNNIYEGLIGLVSPLAATNVNANMVFHPKDTWNALRHGKVSGMKEGEKLNLAERASYLFMNPLLNTYTDLLDKDRRVANAVDVVNNVVSANKDKLDNMADLISAMDDYSAPLQKQILQMEEGGQIAPSLLDSKDQKLYNAFTALSVLNTLRDVEGGRQAQAYKDAMHTLEGLAEGTLSEDEMEAEVDKFVSDAGNRSVTDEGPEAARQVAAERLQKNAQYLIQMKDKMDEIDALFNDNSNMKDVDYRVKELLKYNLVAEDDYKDRLKNIEEELNISRTSTDELYTPDMSVRYGTQKARQSAITAREKVIQDYQEQQDKTTKDTEERKQEVEELRNKLQKADKNSRSEILQKISQQEDMIKANQFKWNTLEESKDAAKEELSSIIALANDANGQETLLSESEILNLDARDRAEILNPENLNKYSKAQQRIIKSTIKNLIRKDPQALMKIRDAGILADRISDLKTVYSRLIDNNALASTYLNAMDDVRARNGFTESLQESVDTQLNLIAKAHRNIKKDPQAFKKAILGGNSKIAEEYIKQHPGQRKDVQPYLDMLHFEEDAAAVIRNSDSSDDVKKQQINTLIDIEGRVNSKEEIVEELSKIVNSPTVREEDKAIYDELLNSIASMGNQRAATIIKDRQELKRQQEEARKREEEARKKLEEKAAEEAQKAAEEQAKKAEEEAAKNQAETLDSVIASDGSDIVDEDENIKLKDEQSVEMDEDGEVDLSWGSVVNSLMDEDAEDAEIDAGEILTGDADNIQQTPLIVSLKKNPQAKDDEATDVIDFKADGKEVVLPITSDMKDVDWDKLGIPKGTPFNVKSIEKINGKWFFKGNFANSNDEQTIQTDEGFDLNNAIEQFRELQKATLGNPADNSNVEIVGDEVQGKTQSLSEQVAETKGVLMGTEGQQDLDDLNEKNDEGKGATPTLSGNYFEEYEMTPLIDEGILIHKKGSSPNDPMNLFYQWLSSMVDSNGVTGIKLQTIIDEELGLILKNNPQASVKFMTARRDDKAPSVDNPVREHLFLVLDYDEKENPGITQIHDKKNGGVLESGGKKYLVIGIAGYGNEAEAKKNGKLNLYHNLFGTHASDNRLALKGSKKHFDKYPNDRFFVSDYSTEIVPMSLIPGWRVKQLEEDTKQEERKVEDLIKDKERNHLGVEKLTDLAWGIQAETTFAIVGGGLTTSDIMFPRNRLKNLGNVFVLIPAANGKYIPAYVRPKRYTEMQEGKLLDKTRQMITQLMDLNPAKRIEAINELGRIFFFDKEGNTILTPHKEGSDPIVTFVVDGQKQIPIDLRSPDARNLLMEGMAHMNPRVNITVSVLGNETRMKEYSEAGALNTDLASLNTAGSSYSIYGLDADGEMIKPANPTDNEVPRTVYSSDWVNPNEEGVIYKKEQYYKRNDGHYYKDNQRVSEEMEPQLELALRASKVVEIGERNGKKIKVLTEGEHPEVILENKNTYEIEQLSEEEGRELIKQIEDKRAKEARRKAAAELNKKADEESLVEGEDVVDLGISLEDTSSQTSEQPKEAEETSEGEVSETSTQEKKKESGGEEDSNVTGQTPKITIQQSSEPSKTMTFKEMFNNSSTDREQSKKVRQEITELIWGKKNPKTKKKEGGKWPDAPTNMDKLIEFLEKKGVPVSGITDVKVWMRTVDECR